MIYFYISLTTYICFCLIKYRETLYYLVKDNYDSKKYGKRIRKDFYKIFINPELIALFLIIISSFFNIKTLEICMVIIYTILFLYKLKTNNKEIKSDKKLTLRNIIIILVYLVLNVCLYINYKGNNIGSISQIYYIILIIITYLSYIVVYIVNKLIKPFDKYLK